MSATPTQLVLAMRIRIALSRHTKQLVDTERLIDDAAYASSIFASCRSLHLADVDELVRRFEASDAASALPPTSAPLSDVVSKSVRMQAGGLLTRPPTQPGSLSGFDSAERATDTDADAGDGDPNDPNHPRNRRYLRGAR